MADSTLTTVAQVVEAKVVAAVAASESPVLAFIKAHYAKVAYAVLGAAAYFIAKKML